VIVRRLYTAVLPIELIDFPRTKSGIKLVSAPAHSSACLIELSRILTPSQFKGLRVCYSGLSLFARTCSIWRQSVTPSHHYKDALLRVGHVSFAHGRQLLRHKSGLATARQGAVDNNICNVASYKGPFAKALGVMISYGEIQ
jgi:hypothetical protein